MTQDEIIRMAREAGLIQYVQVEKTCVSNALVRFAVLVAAHEREKQAEQEPVAERKAQVNELIKESARLIASISDESDRYLTAVDTLRNAYRLGLKDAVIAADREKNK